MKVQLRLLAVAAAALLFLAVPTTAHAGTYTNNYSGKDNARTTTLQYSTSHSAFKLRIWVKTGVIFGSTKYSIKMYNRYGQRVWSDTNQGDRTYYIGSNVTKIVVVRNDAGAASSTYWQKK